jgi:glucose-6-phosphate isomerase
MPYQYQDNLFEHGEGAKSLLDQVSIKVLGFIDYWQRNTSAGTPDYKLFHKIVPQDLAELEALASHIRNNYTKLVIIGIGGSSLNPRMINALADGKQVDIAFLDTTDPFNFSSTMNALNFDSTYFLVISKSGGTLEILSLLQAVLDKVGLERGEQFCFILGSGSSPIKEIALKIKGKIIKHDDKLGGRFATFTNISILPGLVAGLNVDEFIAGANHAIDEFWRDKTKSIPVRSAIATYLFSKNILINIPYLNSFMAYANWYSQIIAESLGKDGNGYLPVQNIGPIDQHSLFQLYLDGPRDKLYTFIYVDDAARAEHRLYGNNLALSEINNALFQAAVNTFNQENLPTKVIKLSTLNEYSYGALLMNSILEVIIIGHLIGVNPFGQPGVERLKTNVKTLL